MGKNIQIGATVDTAAIKAGMAEFNATVARSLEGATAEYKKMAAESTGAITQLSEAEIRNAVVTRELAVIRAADAKAARDAKNATDGDIQSLILAAQARTKLTAATLAAVEANASLAISEGVVAKGAATETVAFETASIAARQMATRVVESAEAAKVSVLGVSSAVGGLTTLLGAGLVVGFFARFIDETQESIHQLDELSIRTGIEIETLAGMEQAAKRTGIGIETVSTALTRMERAQSQAVNGGKQQIEAFSRLGISIADLRSLNPEDLFFRVAEGMKALPSAATESATAITLLGRGGAAMIPIFNEGEESLRAFVAREAQLSGVTKEAAQSSRDWKAAMAELSQYMRSVTIPVVEVITRMVRDQAVVWTVLGGAVRAAFAPIKDAGRIWDEALDKARTINDGAAAPSGVSNTAAPEIDTPITKAATSALDAWEKANQKIIDGAQKRWQETLRFHNEQKKAIEDNARFEVDAMHAMDDVARLMHEAAMNRQHELVREQEARIQGQLDLAKINNSGVEEQIRGKAAMGLISPEQELAQLKSLHARELQEEIDFIQQKLSIDGLEQKQKDQLENQLAQIKAKGHNQEMADEQAVMRNSLQRYQNLFKSMGDNFKTSLNGWLQGTQTFTQAITRMWQGVAMAGIEAIEQVVAKWIMSHVIMAVAQRLFHKQAAVSEAISGATTNSALATSAAFLGAANAYAYWAWNPPVAEAMAAMALGTGLTFAASAGAAGMSGAVAAFDNGGIVPRTGLIFAHQDERVLTAPVGKMLQSVAAMVNNGGLSTAGGPQFPVTMPIYAMDGQSVQRVIGRAGNQISRIAENRVKRMLRDKGIRL